MHIHIATVPVCNNFLRVLDVKTFQIQIVV